MNKILFTMAFAALSFGHTVFASNDKTKPSISENCNSPQVCQFSLSTYTGVINNSCKTGIFKVGLSCPQENDVYATVAVFIDGKIVASQVVKVPAGKTQSNDTAIKVNSNYKGKSYELGVQ